MLVLVLDILLSTRDLRRIYFTKWLSADPCLALSSINHKSPLPYSYFVFLVQKEFELFSMAQYQLYFFSLYELVASKIFLRKEN